MHLTPDPAVSASDDLVLGGRLRLRQPTVGYRVAIDPFLLAAAVDARPGDWVLDLGCGVGAAGLALLTRCAGVRVVGLELQVGLAQLAAANGWQNGLGARFSVIAGDLGASPLARQRFHQVLCNPPFHDAERGRPAARHAAALATSQAPEALADWVGAALDLLRPRGSLTMIHRADRLDELLAALAGRASAVSLLPLWPGRDKPAKRVIIAARKGVAGPLRLLPGLVLHEADGRFTPAAQAILRDGGALPL